MPLFSVILPCHEAAATLPETLAALAAQTCGDWEAICIDDGSRDGTFAVLEAAARAEPRLRVLRQENAGPSAARNRGAALARGAVLAFLDADDLWLPGKLASAAAALEADPAAAAVYGRVAFFARSEEADSTTSTLRPGPATLEDVLGQNPLCTLSNLTVRRDAFLRAGGFDTGMRHAEDLEFLVRLLAGGGRLVGVDALHLRYRASEGGLSADLGRMHAGWRQAVAAAGAAVTPAMRRRAEAVHLRYLARRALRMDRPPGTALALALRGMRLAPGAFLSDRHRGPATLAGCLAAPLMPRALRRRAFA